MKAQVANKEKYLWNTLGSLCAALSSIVLLSAVTRISGADRGGIFTLAYSTAQMLETVGMLEIRPVQSTDVRHVNPFSTYYSLRILSCIVMMLGGLFYMLATGATGEKAIVILLLCAYKMLDAFADVFQGLYQLYDRIDLAGQELFYRTAVSTGLFLLILLLSDNLTAACLAMVLFSLMWIIVFDLPIGKRFEHFSFCFDKRGFSLLLTACFPLFVGTFAQNYVLNAPKYAIDRHMDHVAQNSYGFLAMPAFVINLFSLFFFRPLLTQMAERWASGQTEHFRKLCRKCVLWIAGMTLFAEFVTFLLGIPVLSAFSGRDLSMYRADLMILMLAGAASAVIVLMSSVLTCMRVQRYNLIAYAAGFISALLFAGLLVKAYGIRGGAMSFLLANSCMTVILFAIYGLSIRKKQV